MQRLIIEGLDDIARRALPLLKFDVEPYRPLEKGRILPARVACVSTSGVYGDCGGERVDESRPMHRPPWLEP